MLLSAVFFLTGCSSDDVSEEISDSGSTDKTEALASFTIPDEQKADSDIFQGDLQAVRPLTSGIHLK